MRAAGSPGPGGTTTGGKSVNGTLRAFTTLNVPFTDFRAR